MDGVLLRLPNEIWGEILNNITTPKDLLHLSLVSKRMNSLVSVHAQWRPFKAVHRVLTQVTSDDGSGRSIVFDQSDLEVLLLDTKQLQKVVEMIRETAGAHVESCDQIAKLCKLWSKGQLLWVQKQEKGNGSFFRRQLQKTCKRDFEAYESYETKCDKLKQYKHLGNLVFIACLFKEGFFNDVFVHNILTFLLSSEEEENLYCACRMLVLTGHLLDSDKNNSKSKMDNYFKDLKLTLKTRKLPSQLAFMVKEIIDRRNHGWNSRAELYYKAVECPKRKILWRSDSTYTLL